MINWEFARAHLLLVHNGKSVFDFCQLQIALCLDVVLYFSIPT